MLTIYSAVQRAHRPAYVVKQGERSPSFDVPERVDSILSAISEKELGAVIAPADAGLDRSAPTTLSRAARLLGYERPQAPTLATITGRGEG